MNTDITKKDIRTLLYIGVLLAILIVGFHYLANELSWYWIFKWLDIPMHIFGGVLVGYFSVWGLFVYNLFMNSKSRTDNTAQVGSIQGPAQSSAMSLAWRRLVLSALIGTFVVGILWELLENAYGLSGLRPEYRLDTISDIINDMIGGVIASSVLYAIFKKRFLHSKDSKDNLL